MLACGPSRNPNFPFVLLGRAICHQQLIATRTHADRNELKLDQPLLDWLGDRERKQLAKIFEDIRRQRKLLQRREQLQGMLLAWCQRGDGSPSGH